MPIFVDLFVFGYLPSLGYKCKEVVLVTAMPPGPLVVSRTYYNAVSIVEWPDGLGG